MYEYKSGRGKNQTRVNLEQLIDYSIERKEWEESNPILKSR